MAKIGEYESCMIALKENNCLNGACSCMNDSEENSCLSDIL